jgi:Flp pilus assembly protein TadD
LLWTDDDELTVSGAEVKDPVTGGVTLQPATPEARRRADARASASETQPSPINRSLVEPPRAATAGPALAAELPPATREILETGRNSIKEEKFAEAITLLEDAQKRFPADLDIKLELGRAYLYDNKDQPAMSLFREILAANPSNRPAKLQLARALGYQSHYQESDQLYRELLKTNQDDEAASVGLVRNLLDENQLSEAQRELQTSLARHPDSQRLREFQQVLSEAQEGAESSSETGARGGFQVGENYVTDSSGNSSWRSSHLASYTFANRITASVQAEEQLLWRTNGPRADLFRMTEQLRVRISPKLSVTGSGGTIRFSNRHTQVLFSGDLELHPGKDLWLAGGYSRIPVYPTIYAEQFNVLAEGWHARVVWNPGRWRINAGSSSLVYTDGNRDQRENLELVRWVGGNRLAFAMGYRMDYLTFRRSTFHGYFDPRQYQSHLGVTGVNFGLGRRFRGEYLVRVGSQSISSGPFTLAWELSLRNRLTVVRHWFIGVDYLYLQIAQSTGAFSGQSTQLWLGYRF